MLSLATRMGARWAPLTSASTYDAPQTENELLAAEAPTPAPQEEPAPAASPVAEAVVAEEPASEGAAALPPCGLHGRG